jgi:hypothetical protein
MTTLTLTAGQVHDAQVALTQIMQRPRNIPQMAKYRIARLHTALETVYEEIESQRAKLVQELGSEQFEDETKTKSLGWGIPHGPALETFKERWSTIRTKPVGVVVETIPLACIGNDARGIEADEFKMLAPFIDDGSAFTAAALIAAIEPK